MCWIFDFYGVQHMSKKREWAGRIYLGRDEHGKQRFYWVGRFSTKRERDAAVAKARTERPWETKPAASLTVDEWADRYLARYRRQNKASSAGTVRLALKQFRAAYGSRALAEVSPVDAEDWSQTVSKFIVPPVAAMFAYARRMRVIDHNPFEGLAGGRGRGRADEAPPTPEQMEKLLKACEVLGSYAQQMRALIVFAAYTGLRPGELYELRWDDVDIAAGRVVVSRRLYRGDVDVPKSGRAKTVAIPPPARDVLMRQPTRAYSLVFVSKMGKRLTASTVCQYWAVVRAAAGLDSSYDLYRCTKHFGVHLLYRLGISRRAIAAQMGWSEKAVDQLLLTYGHADLVALSEIDALYADRNDADRDAEVPDEA